MSDHYLTEQHHQLRAEVRAVARATVAPRVAAMELAKRFETDLVQEIARRGWIGATIAKQYGGMGAGHLAKTIMLEELSRVSAAIGAAVQASQLGTAKIIHYGSEEQKRIWLPRIAAGECLPTIASTEPVSGSHLLGMEMRARREGRHYILNGRKVYVGNSHIGDLHGVIARTGKGTQGLSAFLVEADRPGLTLSASTGTLGLHGFSFGELHFNDCRVPVGNRVGAEGDGRDIADSSSVLYGRPNLAAVALGIHQAILDQVTTFTTERTRYGQPLVELTNIKLKLGQIQSQVMTARLALYHATHLLDTGEGDDAALMNAKLINTELVLDSARTAMEIHAAIGLTTDTPMERYLRDAHHILAPAGTSDVQALRLAEVALGTSKSKWSQLLAPHLAAEKTPLTLS
ncbi:acyl-CoA dehydrogenase family protein [Streptomyces lavenduligriseus]|uniref:Acyl-CoA dehydrogenase family protein n=1 Tax=Streptomyces lavenduligriseus TaxID=67315 RepID=A0ABT0P563_9ACTN|nr:acyl-CoA dehydrogenase family protein [Streptomyces lavenduligriseus]MCL3998868.1 acyl-CoA dehydrogenase family protein [Streptomyces lavenduligriseus]